MLPCVGNCQKPHSICSTSASDLVPGLIPEKNGGFLFLFFLTFAPIAAF